MAKQAKRKAPASAAPSKFLHLDTESYTEVTREADPDDRWGADDTSTSWNLNGIRLSDKDGEHALPADFDVKAGDTVYVVYAVYSTGCTFNSSAGAYLEVLSFHKNGTLAHQNVASVQGRKKADGAYTMTIVYDSGARVSRYCPWDGYFESLDYVRAESFVVTESKRH
jgi:hypothetical protein